MPEPASLLELFKTHPPELTLVTVSGIATGFKRGELDEQRVAAKLLVNPADLHVVYGGKVERLMDGARKAVVLSHVCDVLRVRAGFPAEQALEITGKVFELPLEAADELRSTIRNRASQNSRRVATADFLRKHNVSVSFLPQNKAQAALEKARRQAEQRAAREQAKCDALWERERARVQREEAWWKRFDVVLERALLEAPERKRAEASPRKRAPKPPAKLEPRKKLEGVGSVADTKRVLEQLAKKRRKLAQEAAEAGKAERGGGG